MGFIEELNRFEELAAALRLMASPGHIQTALRPIAERSGDIATAELKKNAPDGSRWTEPDYTVTRRSGTTFTTSHGRPSIRLKLGILADQWGEPDIENIEGGVSFTVMSAAPQMDWLLRDLEPYTISKQVPGPMSFYSFTRGIQFTTRWNFPYTIDRKARQHSNFVEDTLERGLENQIASQLDPGLSNIVKPLQDFYRS